MGSKSISWSVKALKQFGDAIEFIMKDSVQNAEKVRLDLLNKISILPEYPEIYPPDKYRIQNDGTYRAFELHRYRVSYRISSKEIRIIRVRHTSMEPLTY
jgi:plasmid stabilization system protein ParE